MLILHNPHKFLVEYAIPCSPFEVFSATPVSGSVKPLVSIKPGCRVSGKRRAI